MTTHDRITFAALSRADFGLLASWLSEPLVARWWNHETTTEALERDFGVSVDGTDPGEVLVASLGGRAVGLLQRYEIAAYPEYVEQLTPLLPVPAGALSVDYLVADPRDRGCGLGARMIAAGVAEGWERYPAARDVIVPVAVGNRASWRSLENAGFVRVAEGPLPPDNPIDPPEHVVYRIRRPGPG